MASPNTKPRIRGAEGIIQLAHGVAEQAETGEQADIEQVARDAVGADQRDAENDGKQDVNGDAQDLREHRHERQVQQQQHDIADIHAGDQSPEHVGRFLHHQRTGPHAPQDQRREHDRRGAAARNAQRQQAERARRRNRRCWRPPAPPRLPARRCRTFPDASRPPSRCRRTEKTRSTIRRPATPRR